MGILLAGYYDKAYAKGGLNSQVKLAMLTKMSLKKAKEAIDSPDNIKLFDEALAKI